MDLLEAIRGRRTTNGHFLKKPVSLEHQRLLMEAAVRAPSHFNSQPWRFALIDDSKTRSQIAKIAGRTMKELIAEGRFFKQYRRYFRLTREEMEERRDGIFIDHLPRPLRPYLSTVFSDRGLSILRRLGVPGKLGRDNRKLVESSPLILAAMLTKEEYRTGDLASFYCVLSLGMAIEHIWLMCGSLGMGIQFISTPMEIPGAWDEIKQILRVPPDLELMALYRLGYVPENARRPSIDWTSSQRKRLSQYVFRNHCGQPEADANADGESRSEVGP